METLEMSLPAALQSLVDRRLDLVDRVLQDARLPRSERISILQELEGQIHQQLEQRTEQPTRDDVLAVISELDPPEAYLSDEAGCGGDIPSLRRDSFRVEAPAAKDAVLPAVPSKLSVWAGFLVSGVALFTAVVMTCAVWVAPELTLGLAAIVQVVALVGAALGAARLLQSPTNRASGLEKAVATVAAMTAPLTVGFLLALAAMFSDLDLAAFLLPGFVGGAWIHGAWLGTATMILWLRSGSASCGRG